MFRTLVHRERANPYSDLFFVPVVGITLQLGLGRLDN